MKSPPMAPKKKSVRAPRAPGRRARDEASFARQEPRQERSRKRLEAIVEAAAELFAAQSFPEVTMDAIAQRAGTPIGSVYQYFEDKRAVFAAVMARSNARAREAFEGVAHLARASIAGRARPALPLRAVLDAAVDGFAQLQETEPSIRAANRNLTFLGELVAEDEALQRELAARTAELFASYFPSANARTRRLVASTVVQLVTSFLIVSDRQDREGREPLEECKLLVRLYVEARLGS
ncbi:MAG: TetR/AcrR family transcriptional regulator [Deltaproteobacteria bacterium]